MQNLIAQQNKNNPQYSEGRTPPPPFHHIFPRFPPASSGPSSTSQPHPTASFPRGIPFQMPHYANRPKCRPQRTGRSQVLQGCPEPESSSARLAEFGRWSGARHLNPPATPPPRRPLASRTPPATQWTVPRRPWLLKVSPCLAMSENGLPTSPCPNPRSSRGASPTPPGQCSPAFRKIPTFPGFSRCHLAEGRASRASTWPSCGRGTSSSCPPTLSPAALTLPEMETSSR